MAQVKSRTVGVRKLMQGKSFADGFREARMGKPFNYDRVAMEDDWSYERGRQLATLYSGPLKDGNRINDGAVAAFRRAWNQRDIV